MKANNRIRFYLKIVLVYLYITQSHHDHCASLSEAIALIKCLSDIVCRVSVSFEITTTFLHNFYSNSPLHVNN